MTRDAKKQSATVGERCKYFSEHEWRRVVIEGQESQTNIVCDVCCHKPRARELDQADAILRLRELIKPGDTLYTILRHVSRSGMQRVIDVQLIKDNEPHWIGWTVAQAMQSRYDDRKQGVVVGGCGMDMGFHIVSTLSRILFPKGFGCIGEREGYRTSCPSNDHSNGDRDYTVHTSARTANLDDQTPEVNRAHGVHWHTSGDYAVRHAWI